MSDQNPTPPPTGEAREIVERLKASARLNDAWQCFELGMEPPAPFIHADEAELNLVAAALITAQAAEVERLRERFNALADELDRAARDRQSWADHPGIGGMKPKLESHLRGKRYGYSHAAQLIRATLTTEGR